MPEGFRRTGHHQQTLFAGRRMTHGGPVFLQSRPEATIVDVQQLLAPPGRVLHSTPPQAPHCDGQHVKPLQTSPEMAPDVLRIHGAELLVQNLPELKMFVVQQFEAPPGRPLQPVPPHGPQLLLQHTKPLQAPSTETKSTAKMPMKTTMN